MELHRDKWNHYTEKRIPFIEANRQALFHKLYIDFMTQRTDINSVLEIGPGQLIEYPAIKKLRPLKYDVVEISEAFIKYCQEHYPEISIIQSQIEQLPTMSLYDYDLVRVCDVIEHTSPVQDAIRNIITCAKYFHITMFKWMTGGSELHPSDIRKDRKEHTYYSTKFPLKQIMKEIEKYGKIDTATFIEEETDTLVEFTKFWDKNRFDTIPPLPNSRRVRFVMTGGRF